MCDTDNAGVVDELVAHLALADAAIRGKVENRHFGRKICYDLRWYVDTILKLISISGDYVSDQTASRVQIVTNHHRDLQAYTAATLWWPSALDDTRRRCELVAMAEFGFNYCREARYEWRNNFVFFTSTGDC
jgi:AP-2 complex subunit alpha